MPRRARLNRFLLTDMELELMRCVWEKGKASASEVQMNMIRGGRETAYTTVKTMLDRLVKAGVCRSIEIRGRYYYSPKVSPNDIAREWYRHLNGMIFGVGSKGSQFGRTLQMSRIKIK